MVKGLCGKCYKSPLKICKKCGETQIHTSKELCYRCYNKQYKPPLKICKKCGKKRQFVTKKLCWDCWSKVKRKTDENYRLRCNLRSTSLQQIQSHGGKKYYSTMKLHDCTFQELIKYLNKTGSEGITVKDIGQYKYHIDHIIPLSSFDLTKEEEQLKAFHYTNLQLLWWEDNLQKGAKLNWVKNDM